MDAAQWMARLQQGDPEALEWLLTRYGGMLQYILGGMLEDPRDREDCLAQVRMKLWESRGSYDPKRSSPAKSCFSKTFAIIRKKKRTIPNFPASSLNWLKSA